MPTWPAWREVVALGSLIGGARFVLLDNYRPFEMTWVEDALVSALSGWIAAWVVLSVRHPPLPPTALVAVRPLHRAFVASVIRTCVAGAIVALLAGSRDRSFLESPLHLVHYCLMAAPIVAAGAFTEEALLGRRDWQAAAAGLFASGAGFYVFVTHAHWVVSGGPPVVGIHAGQTAANLLLLALPIGIVVGVRVRGAGTLGVTSAIALLTPAIVLPARALAEWLEPFTPLFGRLEIVAELVVALPIAVRTGDVIGPGQVVSD